MGCVQSSQTRRSARAKQARRQKLYEQQSFHPKVSKANSSSSPVKVKEDGREAVGSLPQTPREPGKTSGLAKGSTTPGSSSLLGSPSTPSNGNNSVSNNEEIQFRRQHFDRNSMLRHSKKRRKSSASASPNVTANKSLLQPSGGHLTPNRLKFEESMDGGRRAISPKPGVSSPLASTKGSKTTSLSAKPNGALTLTKKEEPKASIPKSTTNTSSPEQHLHRQSSGRLI